MTIRPDDLRGPEVQALLAEHLDDMYATSPPESVHALDLEALRAPDISFYSAWEGTTLLGCGALRDLGGGHVEIKSMRTARDQRGRGTGAALCATSSTRQPVAGRSGSPWRPGPSRTSSLPGGSTPATASSRARRSAATGSTRTASS